MGANSARHPRPQREARKDSAIELLLAVATVLRELVGNSQRLDGGAMFGNAPRALWSRWHAPDEENRVPLACRALLVQKDGRRLLFETGIGAFFDPAMKARYGVVEDEHVLLDSLHHAGLTHEAIDVVVLSHLHFDHAGGLLAKYEAGCEQSLLFPNARFVTSRAAFERCRAPHARDRASFIPGLAQMLSESNRLTLVDSGSQSSLLGDGFHCFQSEGHTPGMLHTQIQGQCHDVSFAADLIPGTAWVHLPITMGYDRFPERLIEEKRALYDRMSPANSWLFYSHDPSWAVSRVARNDKGRFGAVGQASSLGTGWDLDAPAAP